MPLFFFDIIDGDAATTDQNGIDLPDMERAREEATRTVTEIAGQELTGDGADRIFKILVSDSARELLFEVQLDFRTTEIRGGRQ